MPAHGDGDRLRIAGRLLDSVSVITGVSGGSFTALAYGLYGDKLFDDYEQRFLKRDVEGTLLARLFDPSYWGALLSTGWGRSEMAADYYDELLFHGATFADLGRRPGPRIVANATDLSSGARFYFSQTVFDIICSDLDSVRLARAAAASSAVPVVLSPLTLDNYGGTCGYRAPQWLSALDTVLPEERRAALAALGTQEMRAFGDGKAKRHGVGRRGCAHRGAVTCLRDVRRANGVHYTAQPTRWPPSVRRQCLSPDSGLR